MKDFVKRLLTITEVAATIGFIVAIMLIGATLLEHLAKWLNL